MLQKTGRCAEFVQVPSACAKTAAGYRGERFWSMFQSELAISSFVSGASLNLRPLKVQKWYPFQKNISFFNLPFSGDNYLILSRGKKCETIRISMYFLHIQWWFPLIVRSRGETHHFSNWTKSRPNVGPSFTSVNDPAWASKVLLHSAILHGGHLNIYIYVYIYM